MINNPERVEFRKIRDFGEIISITFFFIGRNFKKLFFSVLFIAGPFSLIGSLILGLIQSRIYGFALNSTRNGGLGFSSDMLWYSGGSYLITIACLIIAYTFTLSVVFRFVLLYIKGDEFEIKDLWDWAKKDFFKLLIASILFSIIIAVSFVFCVLPSLYLGTIFSLLFIIILAEDLPVMEAFSRCFQLIKDNWWKSFGVLIIMLILQGILLYLVVIPFSIINLFHLFLDKDSGTNGMEGLMNRSIIQGVLTNIISTLLQPITLIAISFNYFSLVEEKESVGFMEKINTIGTINPDQETPKTDFYDEEEQY